MARRQRQSSRVTRSVNVPEALQVVFDHIVTNPNAYNLWFWSTEVDHCRASSVMSKFDETIINHQVGNSEYLMVNVLSYVLRALNDVSASRN